MVDHDEDLEQRLRQKYSNGANVSGSSLSGPGTQAKYADDAGRGRRNGLAVHLCPVCNGEGKITSNYHGRILESTCEYCEGVGTFTTKNGVKITDEEATQIRREASLQAEGADDKADAKLEADIAKLEGMVKRYSEEVETLENAVSHSTGEKKELHEEVLGQVKIMLERSKGVSSVFLRKFLHSKLTSPSTFLPVSQGFEWQAKQLEQD